MKTRLLVTLLILLVLCVSGCMVICVEKPRHEDHRAASDQCSEEVEIRNTCE